MDIGYFQILVLKLKYLASSLYNVVLYINLRQLWVLPPIVLHTGSQGFEMNKR